MNYVNAITRLIEKHGREVLNDSFIVRSVLSDLVGRSIYDSHLVSCFCWLNEGLGLLKLYQYSDIKQFRKAIVTFYKKEKSAYTKEDVKSTINPLTALLYGEEVYVKESNKVSQESVSKVEPYYETKLSNFKRLVIKGGKGDTRLGYSYTRLFHIISGKKKLNLAKVISVEGETIIINLKKYKGDMFVKLPKNKRIPVLNIEAGSSYTCCDNEIMAKNVTIKSDAYASWWGISKNVTISSKKSVCVICTGMNNINIQADSNITYYLCAESKIVNLTCYSTNGNIDGSFMNGRTSPRVIPWFRHVNCVNTTSVIKGTKVNYDLKAPHGRVKAK